MNEQVRDEDLVAGRAVACEKISSAIAMLEDAQSALVNDPEVRNSKVVHLLRFIATQLAKRIDPSRASRLPDVYPWQRNGIS